MSYIRIHFETDNDAFRGERKSACPHCGNRVDIVVDPEFNECAECGEQWSGELDIYAAQAVVQMVAERLPLYGRPGEHRVLDANGNTVGHVRIHEEWS